MRSALCRSSPEHHCTIHENFLAVYTCNSLPNPLHNISNRFHHRISTSMNRLLPLTPLSLLSTFCICTAAALNGKEIVLTHAPSTAPLAKSHSVDKGPQQSINQSIKDISCRRGRRTEEEGVLRDRGKTKTDHYRCSCGELQR